MKSEHAKEKMTVARYLTLLIERLDVDIIPVIQGGVIMKMIDEVGISEKLKHICPNHEQALAMMVDTYSRIKGFGVGMVTSGPGAVNLATGIACSFYDSIPCLYISGQVGNFHVKRERNVRQRGFQETDVVEVLKPITKYSVLLDDPNDARYIFEKAVFMAKSGRPGPVLIDLPYDVQRSLVVPKLLRAFELPKTDINNDLNENISFVLSQLNKSKKPLILVGGGIRLANMEEKIITFIEKANVPVVTTWGAADIYPSNYDLHIGNIGKSGNQSAVDAIQKCDLLLCLGTRFTPKNIINEKHFAENAKIIAVDIDRSELEEGLISIEKKINCDLNTFIPKILKSDQLVHFSGDKWLGFVSSLKSSKYFIDGTVESREKKYVSPYKFVDLLCDQLSHDSVIVSDAGANLTWVMQAYKHKKGQRLISAWGNSPMGYAVAGAIGIRLAIPDQSTTVISIIGDGGFQMNIQELQTIVGNKIDIKIFILNNLSYGNIVFGALKEFNREFGNTKETGYTVPDFIKVSQAYGINTEKIISDDEISSKLESILRKKGPVIVDVNINPMQDHVETSLIPQKF